MGWTTGVRARLDAWLHRSAAEARMEEEMRFHVEMETEKNVRAGMAPDEARRRATLAFGAAEAHREALRDGHRVPLLEDLWRDARYAARSLGRTPGFAAAAVVTLALGIAATTVTFTAVNGVLLRPLPVHEPGRLAGVRQVLGNGETTGSFSLPEYAAYRDASRGAFSGLAAHHASDVTLSTTEGAAAALGMDVSGNYFAVLGVRPALGRFFTAAGADGAGAEAEAVVSHETWLSLLGGDPAAVGRTIRVNGQPLTVVGVAPAGFHGAMLGARPAVWLPLGLVARLSGRDPADRGWTWLQLFGRLAPGVDAERAGVAMTVAAGRVARGGGHDAGREPTAARVEGFSALPAGLRKPVAGFLFLLLGAGVLVLLIAEVNVAGMLMARGSARRREMGIRLAMGAGRWRLVRQLLTESLLLSTLGGAGGVLVTLAASRWLQNVRPPFAGSFRLDLPVDGRVLAFAVGVSLLTGVLFGVAPALSTAHRDLVPALREGTAGAGRRSRLRGGMVAGQLALSLLLLVAAGLFVRTLQAALRTDHGFDPRGIVAVEMNLGLAGYDEARATAFYRQLLERVRATPGVEAAALASRIPLDASWDQTRAGVPGHAPPEGEPGFVVGVNAVSPGYFRTLGMPLLSGRELAAADEAAGAPPRVVVNETFARRFWPGRSPVGETIRFSGASAEIVGVVPDGKYRGLGEEPTPFAYAPIGARVREGLWLHARTRGDAAAVAAAIRGEIAALDPGVPPVSVTTVEAVMESALFPQRIAAGLLGGFGAVGLVLAAVGLFALLSFSVAERTREIGVRMALGAGRGQVLRLVLGDGARLLAVGIAVGLVAALGATRALRGLLHGLSPTDPVTFAAVPLLLGAVALLAAWLPARRATRVDPAVALRAD